MDAGKQEIRDPKLIIQSHLPKHAKPTETEVSQEKDPNAENSASLERDIISLTGSFNIEITSTPSFNFFKNWKRAVNVCTSESMQHSTIERRSISEGFPINCTCMLCCSTFDNPFDLQSHLAIQMHKPKEKLKLTENFSYPRFNCVTCGATNGRLEHSCVNSLASSLILFVALQLKDGSPLTCILCDGKSLKSIHELIIHVVIYHGFRNIPASPTLSCPFCHAIFKTKNCYIIELHARDVHLPEMVIRKQKMMHSEQSGLNFKVRHFSCYFENTKYNHISREADMSNCSSTFSLLSGLIAHLCYAHYPVPKDFLPTKYRPITCNACLFRFANRTELRDHMNGSHKSFLRFRAAKLQEHIGMSFQDHANPTVVCQFCWTNEGSVARLQSHILVYHVENWRFCGFCKRELCKAHEHVTPAILYLTYEKHVDHHQKQLEKHFVEMMQISQLQRPPLKDVEPPDEDENFFKKIEINNRKNVTVTEDASVILDKLRAFARSSTNDLDFWW